MFAINLKKPIHWLGPYPIFINRGTRCGLDADACVETPLRPGLPLLRNFLRCLPSRLQERFRCAECKMEKLLVGRLLGVVEGESTCFVHTMVLETHEDHLAPV